MSNELFIVAADLGQNTITNIYLVNGREKLQKLYEEGIFSTMIGTSKGTLIFKLENKKDTNEFILKKVKKVSKKVSIE